MVIDWEKHWSTLIERIIDILTGALGAAAFHFLTDKKDTKGIVIVDKDGKPVQTLDLSKFRSEAPHFAKNSQDEAEFAALKNDLQPALMKSLEAWMPTLGHHQQDDVMLTHVDITHRGLLHPDEIENKKLARLDALNSLALLASIPDATHTSYPKRGNWGAKDAHAVTFKIMKANETDYIGAGLTERASAALVRALAELRAWEDYAQELADQIDAGTDEIDAEEARFENYGFIRKFFVLIAQSLDFMPWTISHGPVTRRRRVNRQVAQIDPFEPNSTRSTRHENDCNCNDPRRSKLGHSGCMHVEWDFSLYLQKAARKITSVFIRGANQ